MARTASSMLTLGTLAPAFDLPDPSGRHYRLSDFADRSALIVMFICNHCPFVQHMRHGLAAFARDYAQRDLAIVCINSNDIEKHPEDGPAKMAEESRRVGYIFPYLFDESQSVARAYQAACTPDIYLFDRERKLVYRGQFDENRPGNDIPVTGGDLRAAVEQLLAGEAVRVEQRPSIGCNIKWKPGNEPSYAPKA